jgi:uncharacterized membrane protein YgdD (TMEM256/DUF423 family)
MNGNKLLVIGGAFMLISIVLGAMAAHALAKILPEADLNSFKTGVNYLNYQALGILLLALIQKQFQFQLKWAAWLIIAGTLLFSGSIFLLVMFKQSGVAVATKILGPITPIGGLLMILGWLLFCIESAKKLTKH